jgi:hypothetical protein
MNALRHVARKALRRDAKSSYSHETRRPPR